MTHASHEFGPFYNTDSEILILGSFPSTKSRAESFYYAHPQNRFWRTLATCFGCDTPKTLEEKKLMLSKNKIALWDVIESCDIEGSSDASIKNAVPTDITSLIKGTRITRIILNGKTAERYFYRYFPHLVLPAVTLPSTSPANASWTQDRLTAVWREALM